jgi:hypothetical protein
VFVFGFTQSEYSEFTISHSLFSVNCFNQIASLSGPSSDYRRVRRGTTVRKRHEVLIPGAGIKGSTEGCAGK